MACQVRVIWGALVVNKGFYLHLNTVLVCEVKVSAISIDVCFDRLNVF